MRKGIAGSLALLLLFTAGSALAQVTTIKTPPLAASDTTIIPIFVNIPPTPPWAGWAGSVMKFHLLDATELDVLDIVTTVGGFAPLTVPTVAVSLTPGGVVSPFGPTSSNVASTPASFNFFYATPPSGFSWPTGGASFPASLALHVKNSTIGNNSDIDLSVMLWNIFHLRSATTFASLTITLDPSALIWVNSSITDIGQLHTAMSSLGFSNANGGPLDNTFGHWLHITNPTMFHLDGFGSAFYATFAGTVNLGIEHIPEPTTAMLVGGGFLLLGASRYARRRRLSA